MAGTKMSGNAMGQGYEVKAGFYGPSQRSDQAVKWMHGDEYSYLQDSSVRQCDLKHRMKEWDKPLDKRSALQQRYQGQYTFDMQSGNREE